ncbi:MAG: metallophosphatase family protein [Muribaculaceae bacterium]|nr:metallophosphatase family protein [Muribaculaceae bacterium]
MKRIGILSDTHSCWDERFARHFADCDEVWHAGDIGCIDVIRRLEEVVPVVRAVKGNIDSGVVARAFREAEVFKVEDLTVLMTHIGGYPGRYNPGIMRMILDAGAGLFVCGHSHILKVMFDRELNTLHINPGAAGHHGWHKERTLIKLTVDGADMRDLEVIELGKFKV